MKQHELCRFSTCALCKRRIGECRSPLFWRVRVERWGIRLDALRRLTGLEMMMGSPALAAVMGTDEDLAQPMIEPVTFAVCEECALNQRVSVCELGMEEAQ